MPQDQASIFPETEPDRLTSAQKAWVTRRQQQDPLEREQQKLDREFRTWARRAIADAETRQRRKAEKGRPRAWVTVTVDQLMEKLRTQDYCCGLSGLPFRSGDGGSYGPTIPTLDRKDVDGDYSNENIRIVCLGINSLRGRGSDEQMYRMAEALLRYRRRAVQ